MIRIVRTVITFALLLAGYFGYEHGFAIVSARVQPLLPVQRTQMDLRPSMSLGAQQATLLALRSFGEHHWTSGNVSDVTKYYNNERGYWMYWSTLEFPDDQDRKRIVLSPFAVIWSSNKDGSTKVLTGDRAVIDFDQPFTFMGGGPKPNVVHAKIEGIDEHVLILDDKGSPDPHDDMVVTLPYVEYFEKQMQLRCDDQVQLVDGDVRVRGKGLVISLRPGDGGGGFPGAEVVTLNQKVEITSDDIGSSGFIPGNAVPDQQVVSAEAVEAPKTPGRLSSGSMRLQLPKPRMPAPVGPPAPPAPTIAEFSTNVVIERGADQPDRITGDHLYAILVPGDSPASESVVPVEGEAVANTEPSSGALRLLEARVDGHVVWLESQSERLRCRGNELIYRKPGNDVPEVSYFRADPGQQIEFERMEVDERGNPTSFVTVLAADATLHGDPEKQGRSTVITRGPVLLEMRTRRDGPVERSATARDEMVIETSLAAANVQDETPRTFITLQGWPILNDPKQLTLAAREKVVVSLKPQDAVPVPAGGSGEEPKGRSYQMEWISAVGDVHLVTPEGTEGPAGMVVAGDRKPRRELNAREKLDVVFTYLDEEPAATDVMAGRSALERPTVRLTSQVIETAEMESETAAEAEESTGPVVANRSEATAAGSAEPPSPPFSAEADLVWARIEVVGDGPGIDLTGGSGGSREVREARFRNNVVIHQDPASGKKAGFHVDADYGIDLQNVGPGRMKLFAHGETRPVTIASDDMFIQGFPDPKSDGKVVVGVDQSHDYAFIQGPGRLWNLSERSNMGRLELASADQDEAPAKNREPLIVTWQEAMFFHGQFAEPDGSPGPARALFLGDVKARNGDAGSASQEMEAVFDRPVSFDRALPGSQPSGEQRAGDRELEIASIIGNGQVELWNLVRDAENRELIRELRQSKGESVTFDRQADKFWMDGAGSVSVATLEGGPSGSSDSARRLIPTGAQNGGGPAAANRPMTLTKTKIEFNDGVEGQLGTVGGGYRVAEFRGDARVIRAGVKQYQDDLEFDRPPADAVMLEGDTIYVEHNPAVPGIPDRNFLKAFGGAQARADGKTLLGDTITYDSNTANFFVRGSASAPVTIASQGSFGQPTSRTTARALRYNTNTEESELLDPGSGIFFRPDTGYRIGAVRAPTEKEKEERERPKPRLPGRSDMERQGFTGN